MLLDYMSDKMVCSLTSSGSSVFHQVVARGDEGILEIIADKLDQKTLARVASMTNAKAVRIYFILA